MRLQNSSEIPGPWSRTSTRTLNPVRITCTSTTPPTGENFIAFDSRLVITWIRRSLSTLTRTRSSGKCRFKLTFCAAPYPSLSASTCTIRGLSSTTCKSRRILPDSIFSISRMSLIRRIRRSQLFLAIPTSVLTASGNWPATPPEIRPSDPRMEVSGVRNS